LKAPGRNGKPLSARTVRYLHAIIHKSLADALKWGLVVRNVADAAEPPSAKAAKAPPPKTWSAAELRAFLKHVAEDRLYALWLTYATTGLRRGEALGIRWAALDLDAGQLSVRTERVVAAGAIHESEPKSARGLRTVALDAGTVAALHAHRKRQLEERLAWGPAYEDDGLVFCREDGTLLHPSTVSKRFGELVAGLEVPHVSLHGLRHTWASLALQAGVNPKVVSERLGHATVAFTLDHYSHVIPGMQEDAAAKVAALISGE
jgi:integrase